MKVSDACQTRISVRAYKPDPVSGDLLQKLLTTAARGAASGGNLQPWRVFALTGERLENFKADIANKEFEGAEYKVYPPDLEDPYRSRRSQCAEDMYNTIDIDRDDKAGRMRQLLRNKTFFDAPVGLFFCINRKLGPPQWADLGMYMQSFMLLAVEHGLDTCAQEFWAAYPKTIAETLNLPDDYMVFAGMALGYRDATAPINQLRTRREPLENFAQLIGF